MYWMWYLSPSLLSLSSSLISMFVLLDVGGGGEENGSKHCQTFNKLADVHIKCGITFSPHSLTALPPSFPPSLPHRSHSLTSVLYCMWGVRTLYTQGSLMLLSTCLAAEHRWVAVGTPPPFSLFLSLPASLLLPSSLPPHSLLPPLPSPPLPLSLFYPPASPLLPSLLPFPLSPPPSPPTSPSPLPPPLPKVHASVMEMEVPMKFSVPCLSSSTSWMGLTHGGMSKSSWPPTGVWRKRDVSHEG